MTNPRYDEQFRRGYDGPPVPPPVARAETPPDSSPRIPAAPVESHTSSGLPDDERADVSGVVGVVVTDQEPEPLRRRNPWLIALLVVGLVGVVVGCWLLSDYIITSTINGYATSEQFKVTFEEQLSPALLTGGFVALVAWLVIGALAERSRP